MQKEDYLDNKQRLVVYKFPDTAGKMAITSLQYEVAPIQMREYA